MKTLRHKSLSLALRLGVGAFVAVLALGGVCSASGPVTKSDPVRNSGDLPQTQSPLPVSPGEGLPWDTALHHDTSPFRGVFVRKTLLFADAGDTLKAWGTWPRYLSEGYPCSPRASSGISLRILYCTWLN